ncbi:AI-2E family transporter [Paracoccus caeni]|uniref:AI-2E family transporter n=1 Tax=Paracoccus caeni TaxID=657651 RepID=A0A934SGB2_9RHOB|nr:AI-2E family transporter [Paracoccus caeni]MBK4214654.1 AI-2E family transporter [Paracoccus caeni]
MRMPIHKQIIWWSVAGLLLLLTMWLLGQAILPFILGAGIAYLLDPVADRLERMGLSRTLSVVVITFVVVLIFVAAVLLLVPIVVRQAAALIETMPDMLQQGQEFLTARFPDLLPEGGTLGSAMSDLNAAMGEQWGTIAQSVLTSVGGMISMVAILVIAPVVAFYLLLDWDRMVRHIDRLLPREHAPTIRRIAGDIDETLSGFLRGQGLVILILGTWYSIMLMLVGLPFGFFIGVMAAILSLIPYVGVLIGGATAIGVALFSFWGDWFWIASVVAIFGLGQLVEGNYLQPKIVGGHVGLHPVWLLLALSVFGTLFGFVGMVAAVPMAATLGVIARFLTERYRDSALYTGQVLPPEPGQPQLIEIVPTGTVEQQIRTARLAADRNRAQGQIEEMQHELERKNAE